jgi:hypothetical protein
LADLFSSDPDIDDDVADTRGGPHHDESKEGLVDVADHHAGIISPIADTTGVKKSPSHIPAQQSHAHDPQNEEGDVDEKVDSRRKAAAHMEEEGDGKGDQGKK